MLYRTESAGSRPELGEEPPSVDADGKEFYAREQRLRQEVRDLRIEIDQMKKFRQVSEITETDYFRTLRERAQQMREASDARREP